MRCKRRDYTSSVCSTSGNMHSVRRTFVRKYIQIEPRKIRDGVRRFNAIECKRIDAIRACSRSNSRIRAEFYELHKSGQVCVSHRERLRERYACVFLVGRSLACRRGTTRVRWQRFLLTSSTRAVAYIRGYGNIARACVPNDVVPYGLLITADSRDFFNATSRRDRPPLFSMTLTHERGSLTA